MVTERKSDFPWGRGWGLIAKWLREAGLLQG